MAIFQLKTRQVTALLLLGGLFAALWLLVGPVKAAPNEAAGPPKMTARAGFDGSYKLNSWLPIQVNLNLSEGNPNFEGWLEGSFSNFDEGSTIYRRAVQLVPPANRQAWLYLPTGTRNIQAAQVRLTTQDGTVIDTQDLAIRSVDPANEILLGVISDDSNALSALNGQRLTLPFNKGSIFYTGYYGSNNSGRNPTNNRPAVRVAHLSPADLPPDASGWDSLDGLALTDLSSVTLNDQALNQASLQNAAAAWLAQGRFLFMAGDSGLRKSGFLADFLPVKAGGPPQNKAFPNELRQFLTEPNPPAQLLFADSALVQNATTQLTLDGKPLMAKRPFGLGQSWFAATDLRTLPSSVLVGLWSKALTDFEPHASYLSGLRQPADLYRPWANQLNPNTRLATLPDVGIIVVVLVVYVLLLGPVGYFGLRKLRKLEWAWVLAPALALSVTAGFFVVGAMTSGEPLVLSRLSVITLGETSQGKLAGGVTNVGTIYSSSRLDDLQLNVTDQAQATALTRFRSNLTSRSVNIAPDFAAIQQGPGGGFGSILMGQDDQRSFALESASAGIVGEGIVAKLTVQGTELTGTLENRTGTDWTDLSVWKPGSEIYQVPLIRAGETISLDKSMVAGSNYYNLAAVLAGIEDGKNFSSGSIALNDPQVYENHKAMVLTTLMGDGGEALPKDSDRAYLFGWKQASLKFPLQIGNHAATTNDLTLLFEPLVVS